MFEAGGCCYVYLCYGMHYCMNLVTGPEGCGEALLLRAAAPLCGLKYMQASRGTPRMGQLLNGPGKLTQGLGVDLSHNGRSFFGKELRLVDLGTRIAMSKVKRTPRIGISQGEQLPYRFLIRGSPWCSQR